MNKETVIDKKLPGILIAGFWFTIVLVFILSSILSYQGMSMISIYEEPGPLSSGLWEINPGLFWAGRITGTVGTLVIWFLILRKMIVQQPENKKIRMCIFGVIIIVFISIISWFASTLAVFLTTGFIDIQPKWADNAFIVNVPVYVFGAIATVDAIIIGIRKIVYR